MKTLIALTLFLSLAVLTLGYSGYEQHQQIVSLQTQVSALKTEVGVQRIALASHKKVILQLEARDKQLEKFAVKIVEFFDQLEVIPEKPGANS